MTKRKALHFLLAILAIPALCFAYDEIAAPDKPIPTGNRIMKAKLAEMGRETRLYVMVDNVGELFDIEVVAYKDSKTGKTFRLTYECSSHSFGKIFREFFRGGRARDQEAMNLQQAILSKKSLPKPNTPDPEYAIAQKQLTKESNRHFAIKSVRIADDDMGECIDESPYYKVDSDDRVKRLFEAADKAFGFAAKGKSGQTGFSEQLRILFGNILSPRTDIACLR